jgi:hypothetical protein
MIEASTFAKDQSICELDTNEFLWEIQREEFSIAFHFVKEISNTFHLRIFTA